MSTPLSPTLLKFQLSKVFMLRGALCSFLTSATCSHNPPWIGTGNSMCIRLLSEMVNNVEEQADVSGRAVIITQPQCICCSWPCDLPSRALPPEVTQRYEKASYCDRIEMNRSSWNCVIIALREGVERTQRDKRGGRGFLIKMMFIQHIWTSWSVLLFTDAPLFEETVRAAAP